MLIAIKNVGSDKYGQLKWLCLCDCGKSKVILGGNLSRGLIVSCSCFKKIYKRTHGYSKHKLYAVYHQMIKRCHKKIHKEYPNYGKRGISVCKEWRGNPKGFIDWAFKNGWKKGLSIDRIDNDGNYNPKNCRFATQKQQCRNMRRTRFVFFKGNKISIAELLENNNCAVGDDGFKKRLKKGWSVEESMFIPARKSP